MRGQKEITYFGAVVLGLLMTFSAANVLGTQPVTVKSTVPIVYSDAPSMTEPLAVTQFSTPLMVDNRQGTGKSGADIQVTNAPETENTPAIAAEPVGSMLLSYTTQVDVSENNIIYGFSTDGGQTFDPGVFFNIPGLESYPSLDYRNAGTQFVGTFQGDPLESNGAIQYEFYCADILDYNTYELTSIDWSSLPYTNRLIPDMAGYNYPGIDWWHGVTVCVGTRESPGSVNMPIFNYPDYTDPSNGWSKYFATYSGCENAAIDIDQNTGFFYAAFDYLNPATSSWDLLLFRGDCHNDGSGSLKFFSPNLILGGPENITHPAIAVQDNKVVILAERDIAGNKDIVCYYSLNSGVSWTMSVAVDSADDETAPTIVTYGDDVTGTFMMNGNLYVVYSEDAGVTWSTETQVNDENGMVQPGYRNSDITFGGKVVWTDIRNGNPDIYLDDVGGSPAFPIISLGVFSGGLGKVSIPVKNIGEEDATNVTVTLTVTGGILGRINVTTTQSVPLAIDEEVTITTDGFIFGLGKLQLSATASCTDALPPVVDKTATAKILIILVTGIA